MQKISSLSTGTKLLLVACAALFLNLSLTWQRVQVDFGAAGRAEMLLDGWDAWGLLLALLVLSALTLVVLTNLTEVEMSSDIPWTKVTLALGLATFVVAVLKSLTDAGSSWASYAFVALAAGVAVGAYLDWAESRKAQQPLLARRRRGISSAA